MPVSNEDIAEIFENMATLLEMKGDTVFKIRAYQRAARTIGHLSFSLEQAVGEGVDLKKIPRHRQGHQREDPGIPGNRAYSRL